MLAVQTFETCMITYLFLAKAHKQSVFSRQSCEVQLACDKNRALLNECFFCFQGFLTLCV